MSLYIEAWFALTLVVIGLSHSAQPRLWSDFFVQLKRTGVAPLIIGMYTLPTGLLLLVGHNRWAWDWGSVVTLAGWGMTLKATLYLVFPWIPDRMIDNAVRWQSSCDVFRVVGVWMVVLGVVLGCRTWGQMPS